MKHLEGRPLRKVYMGRFIVRCAAMIIGLLLYFFRREVFSVLPGMAFFDHLSILHLIWVVWVADMLMQLVPLRGLVALGSQKVFVQRFRPAKKTERSEALIAYTKDQNRRALWIAAVWGVMVGAIGILYGCGILNDDMLLLVTLAFYVCDLICVLFWCPFRVYFLRNRCCTTCRIFNWDHLMMFSPLIYLKSFYAWSLILMSVLVVIIWEVQIYRHPERFWEGANDALKCRECTDKLCLRYSTMFKK